jgi:hypothetical protein
VTPLALSLRLAYIALCCAAIAYLLLCPAPALANRAASAQRAVAFDTQWNRYVRRMFGCPEFGPTDETTCRPSLGAVDYASYRKARELAKPLFDLRD